VIPTGRHEWSKNIHGNELKRAIRRKYIQWGRAFGTPLELTSSAAWTSPNKGSTITGRRRPILFPRQRLIHSLGTGVSGFVAVVIQGQNVLAVSAGAAQRGVNSSFMAEFQLRISLLSHMRSANREEVPTPFRSKVPDTKCHEFVQLELPRWLGPPLLLGRRQ
jgi:hypothetical protein